MKIHVLSDVHLEFSKFQHQPPECDVVVLAGDTAPGLTGVAWAEQVFGDTPVIYVPGNHEYYGRDLVSHSKAMREGAQKRGIHFLLLF